MDFARGGELFTQLRMNTRFSENRAKFYSFSIALALAHLHSSNIVYRDLRPENVLIWEDGYIALTDFGFAKVINEGEAATTFAGTPDYMAPEIIME